MTDDDEERRHEEIMAALNRPSYLEQQVEAFWIVVFAILGWVGRAIKRTVIVLAILWLLGVALMVIRYYAFGGYWPR
jgi:hypothetical protein